MWAVSGLRSAGTPAERLLADDPLRDALADPWFVAAITWQNPDLVRNWLGAKHRAAATARLKPSQERILAAYLQRYAAKNDVIGVSGPSGFARWTDDSAPALVVRPGDAVIRDRRVCFEPWALEAMVAAWAADPALRWHMPVAPDHAAVLRGTRLHRNGPAVELDPLGVAIFRAADGYRGAVEIFADLVDTSCSDYLLTLTELADRGVVHWSFTVPLDAEPECSLRSQLGRVGDPRVRARMLADLDTLELARAAVAKVADDPIPLLAALSDLDDVFAETVAVSARRDQHGEVHAHGRRLLYLDSIRDVQVQVGLPLRQALAGPLSLVLDSARWLTASLADAVRTALTDRLGAAETIPFFDVYDSVAAVLRDDPDAPLRCLLTELPRRWAKLLGVDEDQRRFHTTVADIELSVREQFAAHDYGWAAARQHSPDVMLAVRESNAGGPTDFHWVLGEVHVAINTLENRVFTKGYPAPQELHDCVARDFTGGRILPAFARREPRMNQRTYPPLTFDLPDRYRYWAISRMDTLPPDRQRTPGADLWLRRQDGRLRVVSSDGRFDADPVEVLGEFLSWAVAEEFTLLPRHWRHAPRVTVDRCVLSRETWRVRGVELLGDAKAVLAELGTPRHAFVRVPGEAKPFLLDVASEPLLRQLARSVRKAVAGDPDTVVTISEMLPDFGDLWLTDAQGQTYTSEFRLVAVDGSAHTVVVE